MTPDTSAAPSVPTLPPQVPLVDLARQNQPLESELFEAIGSVLRSGRFVLGPECQQLEQSLGEYCRVEHSIACASGSDALLLALLACGVRAGDDVLLPSYTFFATAGAVARIGARPVFVEIEPEGFNIDPCALEAAITERTRAIIPVHLFGQCAEMEPIVRLSRHTGIPIIEDAAQAIGAEYNGQRAGAIGDVGCFSFYPTKNLGCFGDGGLVTTHRRDLADRLRLLRVHGMQPRYYHKLIGINSRLDTLQAAVLNVKVPHLDRWTAQRQQVAERYTAMFTESGLDRVLGLPITLAHRRHVWNQYIVRIPGGKRDLLREHLNWGKIGTEIYYPVPLHLQECFLDLGYCEGMLPVTEQAALETIALPMFPELTADEQWAVVREIAAFFGCGKSAAGHGIKRPKFLDAPVARPVDAA